MGKFKINFHLLLSLIMYLLTASLSFSSYDNLTLSLLILCAVIEIIGVKKKVGNYSNILLIFTFFSILYGISGPITTLWGNGLEDAFIKTYNYGSWFLAYSLSQIGLILGLCFDFNNNKTTKIENEYFSQEKVIFFAKLANILMLIGSVFQLINMYRIGGFSVLFMKKAIYQAREGALSLTLPSSDLVYLSIACFSVYCGFIRKYNKIDFKYVILEIIFSIPYLLQLILLGQRGKMINILLIICLGIFYFKPLKKVNMKLVKMVLVVYIFMVFIYTNRSILDLVKTDKNLFYARVTDLTRYVDNLNPGTNEFGAAFGNFNTLMVYDNYEFKLGETYLKGLAVPIPSFLYPGDKPQQITYEFRDQYFSSWANRSAIASTGFSSILEAYWNFGYIGIICIYILYGIIINYLENKFKYKSVLHGILYLCIATNSILFSRMAFGDTLSSVFYIIIYFFIFVVMPYSIKKWKGD